MTWWEQRYEALAAIDPAFAGRVDRHAEAQTDLLERVLELRVGDSVLDLGCGAGRHSILLQERGFPVVGVDLSRELLDLAERTWDSRHPGRSGPRWVRSDMRSLPELGPFAAAVMLDVALGVFDDDADHLVTLAAVADRLRPGGRLVLELFNPYFWAQNGETRHYPPGSLTGAVDLVRSYHFDALRGRVEDRVVVFEGGERRELPTQSLRCWTPPEIVSLASAAGFQKVEVFGSQGWQVPDGTLRLDPARSVFMWVVATL
jgi:SAM-dependent methyltransferase